MKYLFSCTFTDGSTLNQTLEDLSACGERSAFYDVAQSLDEVAIFTISGENHTYTVDLSDGSFRVDGVPFFAGDPDVAFPHGTKFRLMYFRRVTQDMIDGVPELSNIVFHVGWQTTVDGRNFKQTIQVS